MSKALRDLRWQVLGYGLGLALMSALVVAIYPSYRAQFADFDVPPALEGLTGSIVDFSSAEGFLSVEFVSWVPIVTLIFAIMAGTSALAGEEANGTLDLLLAQPISRRRLILEKIAAICVATLAIVVLACLGWLASVPFVDIEISLPDLFIATLNVAPITMMFAFLALWLGAAMSDRRAATAAVTAFAVVTYFVNYLARIVDVLEPLAWASPFHYYDSNVLLEGPDWSKTAVLVVLLVLFAAAAAIAFEKRDVGVGSGWRLSLGRRESGK
jgi:ABC-2 type transport system permease protein